MVYLRRIDLARIYASIARAQKTVRYCLSIETCPWGTVQRASLLDWAAESYMLRPICIVRILSESGI
jgi:hypothetical protein